MLESTYAEGKTKNYEVAKKFASNAQLVRCTREGLAHAAQAGMPMYDQKLQAQFAAVYANKDPEEVLRHLSRHEDFFITIRVDARAPGTPKITNVLRLTPGSCITSAWRSRKH